MRDRIDIAAITDIAAKMTFPKKMHKSFSCSLVPRLKIKTYFRIVK